MATESPNTTITATSLANARSTPLFLSSSNGGNDRPVRDYVVHNRDSTNYVRIGIQLTDGTWLVGQNGGFPVAPGATQPFASNGQPIGAVYAWAESGTPAIDGGGVAL